MNYSRVRYDQRHDLVRFSAWTSKHVKPTRTSARREPLKARVSSCSPSSSSIIATAYLHPQAYPGLSECAMLNGAMVRRKSLVLAILGLCIFSILTFTVFSDEASTTDAIKASLGDAYDSSAQTASRISSWISIGETTPLVNSLAPPLNFSKVATMIETRNSPMLVPILQSWLSNVPFDWPFVVWTSAENHENLTQIAAFKDEIASGRLNFTRIDTEDSPYRPDPKLTATLSDMLANTPWFWTQFHPAAEHMLFFQVDSVLCSNARETVDDWLGYDFIGGPTPWSHDVERNRRGGNGGLSMRRISSMRKAIDDEPRRPGDLPEDVWFTRRLETYNSTRWPEDEGRSLAGFSLSQAWFEDYRRDSDWQPLGVHYGSQLLTNRFYSGANGALTNQLHRIVQHCPEFLYLHYAVDEFQPVDMNEFRPEVEDKAQGTSPTEESAVERPRVKTSAEPIPTSVPAPASMQDE